MKRFILRTLLYTSPILLPLMVFIGIIYPNLYGDIGPLGYLPVLNKYGTFSLPAKNKVIDCMYDYNNFEDSCIFIIGDSFSLTEEDKTGYTYFIGQKSGRQVVNLYQQWYHNPFDRFLYMSKTQELPKTVVVETVERLLMIRTRYLDLTLTPQQMISRNRIDTSAARIALPKSRKSLLAKAQEWSKRGLGVKDYDNPIKKVKLSKPCFTSKYQEKMLYFYEEDVHYTGASDQQVDNAIAKIDALFAYAESIGIDLYILIAADKYDVYQDYIIDNPYPRQDVLDRLFTRYQHPRLINSRDTLEAMLEKDVMDIYWGNNTHWSLVGAEAVAEQVMKRMEVRPPAVGGGYRTPCGL